MIRKLVVIAAAVALPVSTAVVFAGVGGGIAAAKGSPNPPVTCTVSATVTFAPPGISKAGSVSTKKSTDTDTSGEVLGGSGCTGSGANLKIASASTLCTGTGEPSSNPACFTGKKKEYGYNSWSNYVSGGASSLSALKDLKFTINSLNYEVVDLTGTAVGCADSEVGFNIVGTVKKPSADKGQQASLTACLGTVTGTDLSGPTFADNIDSSTSTVATAQIDPATSSLAITDAS